MDLDFDCIFVKNGKSSNSGYKECDKMKVAHRIFIVEKNGKFWLEWLPVV